MCLLARWMMRRRRESPVLRQRSEEVALAHWRWSPAQQRARRQQAAAPSRPSMPPWRRQPRPLAPGRAWETSRPIAYRGEWRGWPTGLSRLNHEQHGGSGAGLIAQPTTGALHTGNGLLELLASARETLASPWFRSTSTEKARTCPPWACRTRSCSAAGASDSALTLLAIMLLVPMLPLPRDRIGKDVTREIAESCEFDWISGFVGGCSTTPQREPGWSCPRGHSASGPRSGRSKVGCRCEQFAG